MPRQNPKVGQAAAGYVLVPMNSVPKQPDGKRRMRARSKRHVENAQQQYQLQQQDTKPLNAIGSISSGRQFTLPWLAPHVLLLGLAAVMSGIVLGRQHWHANWLLYTAWGLTAILVGFAATYTWFERKFLVLVWAVLGLAIWGAIVAR
jgi:hypothetical protein